jgi:hypothetical protein
MKNENIPCYKCTNRTPTCHATCEKYLEFFKHSREIENSIIRAPGRTAAYERRIRAALLDRRKKRRRKSSL